MTRAGARRWLAGLGVAVATATLLVATGPRLAIVWDEGYTLGREARLRSWFRALRDPPRFAATWQPPTLDLVQPDGIPPPTRYQLGTRAGLLFDRGVLAWFWPFAREEPHGHPPFYALVGLVGDVLAPSWPALDRARLGPMLAFSLAAGALFVALARRAGTWAGVVGAGAWVLQPNLFGHGHYATYDALLASLWLGALLAFARAVEADGRNPRWGWAVGFGVLAGCAADTKLTGWLLPLPLLAWVAADRDRRGLVALAVGGLVALLVLYALNPPWWGDPVAGVARFWVSNLSRGRTIPIPVRFLGKVVTTPNESLPWYNTLAWTVLVTPVGFLALAVVGAVRAIRHARGEPFGTLVLIHWAFLLVLRALPHTPGHDGVRQFLPAFGMLAVMAGLGTGAVVAKLGRWGKALVVAALVEGTASVALMMPVPLSYYSPVVGGLPGATALGMEPTYYWDALSDGALDWLNRNTPPGHKVAFASFPTSWLYLRQTGRLTPEVLPMAPGAIAWYVVQNRPGAFGPRDRALIAGARPSYVVSKWGVPLIWVFPFRAVERLPAAPAQ